jgi:hypothetical protein
MDLCENACGGSADFVSWGAMRVWPWKIESLVLLCGGLLFANAQAATTQPAARPTTSPATQPHKEARPLEETVIIDLDRSIGPLNGHLNGVTRALQEKEPPDEVVAPLKAAVFRQPGGVSGGKYRAMAVYARASALGGRVQVMLGDSLKFDGRYPGEKEDWGKWDAGVMGILDEARQAGAKLEWDIWSEPDRGDSWKGSKNEYFRCWYHTVKLIRGSQADAVIVGPSISHFDGGWLEGFMKDCKDFDVEPTLISWHESSAKPDITGHINSFEENCWQDGLGFRRFCINQTVGRDQALSAGVPVFYLAGLERARVNSAARAHFTEHGAQVGSLLTGDYRPRAAWWTYRMYTELRGEMPKVTGSTAMDALAAYDAGEDKVRVLVGRDWARSGKRPGERPVFGKAELKLAHVPGISVHVTAQRIPAMREKACEGMLRAIDADFHVDKNTHEASIVLPEFEDGGAYWVEVTLVGKPTMKRGPDDVPSAFNTRLKL